MDMSALMMNGRDEAPEEIPDDGLVHSNGHLGKNLQFINSNTRTNDLEAFGKFLKTEGNGITDKVNAVQYLYDLDIFIYNRNAVGGTAQVNPGVVYDMMFGQSFSEMMSASGGTGVFGEMIDDSELLSEQYEVLAGRWPNAYDELVITVDKYNRIGDFELYALGLRDQSRLPGLMDRVMAGEDVTEEPLTFTYEELMGLEFQMLLPSDLYADDGSGVFRDIREKEGALESVLDERGVRLKVVGVIRPKENTAAAALTSAVSYTPMLTEYVIKAVAESDAVKAQTASPDTDIFTGLPFDSEGQLPTKEEVLAYIAGLSEEEQAEIAPYLDTMSDEELIYRFKDKVRPAGTVNTYEGNLERLGSNDLDKPSAIVLYPTDFKSKDGLKQAIDKYNDSVTAAGEEDRVITYTDYVGILMSSVSTIINVISYVLIAFVAVSLVVSSIMIGVITNISVLERTKEIGVLRAIGASKRDISRVFNAETLIIGFISGLLGLIITELLIIPVNALIYKLGGIRNVARLPWRGALILLAISMLLTLIAGLIPSRKAARKDPVVALRTE